MKDHDVLFKSAVDAGRKRNYKKSLKHFKELVSLTDEYPAAFLYMGRCCHALNLKDRAIQYFKYYLKNFPDSPSGLFFMGRSYLSLGAFREGLSALNRVYKIKPDYPQLKAFLGMGYLKAKKIDSAVSFLAAAVEEDPENSNLYQGYLNALYLQALKAFYREDTDLARQIFMFLEEKGVETSLLHLHMAIIEKETGNYRASIEYYDRVLAEEPGDQLIRIQRAEALYLGGFRDEAFAEWREIPALKNLNQKEVNPVNLQKLTAVEHYQQEKYRKAFYFATRVLKQEKDINMQLLAGESARNLGNNDIAENHFHRVLEKAPSMVEPRYGLIMIYWQESKWDLAIQELDKLGKIAPGDEISRYYRTLCLCKLDYSFEKLIPMIQEEIRSSGPDPWLFTSLAVQYIRGNMEELAEKWYQKAIILKEDYKEAYRGLINVQSHSKRSGPLKKTYREYLKRWENDRSIRRDFANLLFKEKKYKSTVSELEKLIPYYNQESGIHRLLAFCYRECGRYSDAALIYRVLLKSEPENQIYLRSLVYCLDKNGDRGIAILILEKALAFIKSDSGIYLILGVFLFRDERFDDALSVFKKAHEITPRDWRPLYNIGIIYREKEMEDYAKTYFSRADNLKK